MYGDLVSSDATVFIPFSVYSAAMGLQESENPVTVAAHSLVGLRRGDLISTFAYGQAPLLQPFAWALAERSEIQESGLIVSASPFGAELFMYVHGKSDYLSENDFFSDDIELQPSAEINIPEGSIKLNLEEKHLGSRELIEGSF